MGKVIGSNPIGNSDFFPLLHSRDIINITSLSDHLLFITKTSYINFVNVA